MATKKITAVWTVEADIEFDPNEVEEDEVIEAIEANLDEADQIGVKAQITSLRVTLS